MKKPEERGLMYKTSRISYVSNYFLVILLLFLLSLLLPYINFTLTPGTVNELLHTMLVFGFVIVIVYLIEEPAIERILRQYVITDNEVMKIEGFFRKKKVSIPYPNAADLGYNKSILGRIFNFGTVTITGFREEIAMKGLRNPEEVYKIIENKISSVRGPRVRRIGKKEEIEEE